MSVWSYDLPKKEGGTREKLPVTHKAMVVLIQSHCQHTIMVFQDSCLYLNKKVGC